jgi:3D (Asp-Asp-Asp) domain-containing protein
MLTRMNSHMKWRHLLIVILAFVLCIKPNDGHKAFSSPTQAVPNQQKTDEFQPQANKPKQGLTPKTYLDQLEAVEVTATGYTAGIESTGKTPKHPQYGITYSGVKVRKSMVSTIAADTKVFPLGTLLYIPGYGYGIVADTGSAIKGNKIDLFFWSKKEVYANWGKRNVKVYILKKGDGKVTEMMLDRLNEVKAFAQHPPLEKIEL